MTKNLTPLDGERWYYLDRSLRECPYSQGELRFLLAKGVIRPTTLIWHQRRRHAHALRDILSEPATEPHKGRKNWVAAALGVALIFGGTVAVLKIAGESEEVIASITKATDEANQDHDSIQISDRVVSDGLDVLFDNLAPSNFGPRRHLIPAKTGPVNLPVAPGVELEQRRIAGFGLNSIRPSPIPVPPTTALRRAEGQFAQEFWRSMASSNIADRYELYLRRFPSGAFADIATDRIKELRKNRKNTAVSGGKAVTAKKVKSINSSMANTPATSITTTDKKVVSVSGGKTGVVKQVISSSATPVKRQPAFTHAALRTPAQETVSRCRERNSDRCREPLKAAENGCTGSTKPPKPCIVRNYQSSNEASRSAQR